MSAPVLNSAHRAHYVMLDSLTILRGPAALLVFFYHIVHNTHWANRIPAASVGYVGVALFFVLSGFVLTWSYKPNDGYKKFYVRRFARVYPLHFFFFLVALGLLFLTHGLPSVAAIIANLFLLQAWVPNWDYIFSVNGVSWSLSCEMFFYACTPLILNYLNRVPARVRYTILIGWFILCATVAGVISTTSNYADVVVYANPLLRSGEFALGMVLGLLALAVRDRKLVPPHIAPWHLVTVILIAFGTVYMAAKIPATQTLRGFLLDPVWVALIGACALYDMQRSHHSQARNITEGAGHRLRRLGVYLGEVSFAFYLVHELAIIHIVRLPIGAEISGGFRGIGITLLTLILSLLLAIAAHHIIERPARTLIISTYSKQENRQ